MSLVECRNGRLTITIDDDGFIELIKDLTNEPKSLYSDFWITVLFGDIEDWRVRLEQRVGQASVKALDDRASKFWKTRQTKIEKVVEEINQLLVKMGSDERDPYIVEFHHSDSNDEPLKICFTWDDTIH